MYYKNLKANRSIKISNFVPLFKLAKEKRKTIELDDVQLYICGVRTKISFDPFEYELKFTFKSNEGEEITRTIDIVEETSNLPNSKGKIYYFLCPRSWKKCRILYKINTHFWSRRGFKAYYPQQMDSKILREVTPKKEPFRKYGKEYYRGKLTPYGKRCERFYEYENKRASKFMEYVYTKRSKSPNQNKMIFFKLLGSLIPHEA